MASHAVRLLSVALALLLTGVNAKKDDNPLPRPWMPPALERFGLLEEVAKLEERMDPEAELWVQLLQPLLVPRYVGTPAHEHVRQHIVGTLTALGWEVDGDNTFQMQTPVGVKNFTNIVASHHAPSERRLVLACHYDSIFGRDRFVAATDSAVPCAMMLYLAVLMTARYLNPTRGRSPLSLQLLFLDGEEAFVRWTDQDSIYGARHMAETMSTSALENIDLFVLLDLLGAANPKISNLQKDSDEQFKHLASIEEKLVDRGLLSPDVPKVFQFKENFGVWGRPQISDDHLPFLRRGVRILHLIPHPFPSVWHEDSDDAVAVHYPTVQRLNTVLRVFVAEALQVASYL